MFFLPPHPNTQENKHHEVHACVTEILGHFQSLDKKKKKKKKKKKHLSVTEDYVNTSSADTQELFFFTQK